MMAGPQRLQELKHEQNKERGWSPYEVNGGSCCAIGQPGYCVIAADTRLSRGYSILSRTSSKAVTLTENCVLVSGGMQADRNQLHTILLMRLKQYKLEHGKEMSVPAVAQYLSYTLYTRRFFPYYTFNLLCGVKEDGQGVVYGYDAIGSFKEDGYGAQGSGMEQITPMLDFTFQRAHDKTYPEAPTLSLEEGTNIVKSAIEGVSERDIQTGDHLELFTITKEGGVKREIFNLRKD